MQLSRNSIDFLDIDTIAQSQCQSSETVFKSGFVLVPHSNELKKPF